MEGEQTSMKMVDFGRNGLKVTEYCLGCLTMGRLQSNLSNEAAARVITTAVENGVNFIDTAETYGNDDQIKTLWQTCHIQAKCFSDQTFPPMAHDRISHLA